MKTILLAAAAVIAIPTMAIAQDTPQTTTTAPDTGRPWRSSNATNWASIPPVSFATSGSARPSSWKSPRRSLRTR